VLVSVVVTGRPRVPQRYGSLEKSWKNEKGFSRAGKVFQRNTFQYWRVWKKYGKFSILSC
jgi:hypothetical protein